MNTQKSISKKNDSAANRDSLSSLILHNDDYHTFDYVIDALVEICNMDIIQATQCTFLVHYKQKCEVKKGSLEVLLPMRRALAQKDLKAVIE
jgi:ATP-dependent Clp protease adaptor protein ClpS